MIKNIELIEFQSHRKTSLIFAPGFNVITGESDSGKSSIAKAIEWVRTNRPSGGIIERAINIHAKEMTVVVDNVKRTRSLKDTGSYKINSNEKTETFSVMGGNVPEQVSQELNLDDINMQLQLEGHFLILETPGKAASYLNTITKLDKLDTALSVLKSKKMQSNSKIKQHNEELLEIKTYLISGIVEQHGILKEITEELIITEVKLLDIGISIKDIDNLLQEFEAFECDKLPVKEVEKLDMFLNDIDIKLEQLDIVKEEEIQLSDFVCEYEAFNKNKLPVKIVNKVYSDIDKAKVKIYELNVIRNHINTIIDTINSYNKIVSSIATLEIQYKETMIKYTEIKKLIQHCPSCGSKLTNITRKRLLENV